MTLDSNTNILLKPNKIYNVVVNVGKWPCSAYLIFGLFGFFFQLEQCFSLTAIQSEQCFSASFSQVLDQRTGPFSSPIRSIHKLFHEFK